MPSPAARPRPHRLRRPSPPGLQPAAAGGVGLRDELLVGFGEAVMNALLAPGTDRGHGTVVASRSDADRLIMLRREPRTDGGDTVLPAASWSRPHTGAAPASDETAAPDEDHRETITAVTLLLGGERHEPTALPPRPCPESHGFDPKPHDAVLSRGMDLVTGAEEPVAGIVINGHAEGPLVPVEPARRAFPGGPPADAAAPAGASDAHHDGRADP